MRAQYPIVFCGYLLACLWTAQFLPPSYGEKVTDTTPISPDNPASLQRGIDSAYRSGIKKIVIPRGTYKVNETIRIEKFSDFEIEAYGVTLLRTQPETPGVQFRDCSNVTLKGITITCEKIPLTQGVIDKVDPQGTWFELIVDTGYPLDYFKAPMTGHAFNPATRLWKNGIGDFRITAVTQVDSSRFRFQLETPASPGLRALIPGDLMAFRGRGKQDIHLFNCAKMKIIDVTILSGSGFCVHEEYGAGDNYYSYKVTYGAKPAGATASPLMSAKADAFHSWGTRHGPTLENCTFEGMCDDGIPIHGFYSMIFAAAGTDLIIAQQDDYNTYVSGDILRLFNPTGAFLGEGKVLSCTELEGERPAWKATGKFFLSPKKFFRLKLDRTLPAEPGFLVNNPNAEGSHYVIRNCTIRNNRARGILVKADHGLIEGNTIDGSTSCAIVIAPELSWNESCYSRNVVIRNNIFRRCGYSNTGPGRVQAGVVSILGVDNGKGSEYGHQGITIENNRFEDNDGVQLIVDSARDIRVIDNAFVRAQHQANDRGSGRKIDPNALIFLRNCKDVVIEGNTISNRGPYGKTFITAMPDALNISGQKDGLKETLISP